MIFGVFWNNNTLQQGTDISSGMFGYPVEEVECDKHLLKNEEECDKHLLEDKEEYGKHLMKKRFSFSSTFRKN